MTGAMTVETDFDALTRRLTASAAALAVAWAAGRRVAARDEDARWRRAGLVWPLFAKG